MLQLLASASALFVARSAAQTYTSCNPLAGSCPPDTALGRSISYDFTKGGSSDFVANGVPTYDSNGVSFTVAKSGDSPQLTSNWFIMFGQVDVVLKAAPGAGIVSSFVLESNDLDEIDWEWLGAQPDLVQSNYFGKGNTQQYNRGATHNAPGSQDGFHTYTVIWTQDQVTWQIDGATVRTLTPATADANQYPQTPMQLKIGAWSGGDPANAPGTIQWAMGPTDYSKGPFTMQVKSVSAVDYSTGTQYKYGDESGNWQSIISVGGKINGNSGAAPAAPSQDPPTPVSSSTSGEPIPFQSSSTYTTPTVYPWVPSSTLSTSTATYSIPGLPSGWSVSSSGKSTSPVSSTSSPSPSHPPSTGNSNPATLTTATIAISTNIVQAAPSAPNAAAGDLSHMSQGLLGLVAGMAVFALF